MYIYIDIAQSPRGFVVSASLRGTCWPLYQDKWQFLRNFRIKHAENRETPGSFHFLGAHGRRRRVHRPSLRQPPRGDRRRRLGGVHQQKQDTYKQLALIHN